MSERAAVNVEIDAKIKTEAQIKAMRDGLKLRELTETLFRKYVEGTIKLSDDDEGRAKNEPALSEAA